MTLDLLIEGTLLWCGPQELIDGGAVGLSDGRVAWYGRAADAPEARRSVSGDWYLMPGVVDHHVHIAFAEPARLLRGGLTRVHDLAWPVDQVMPLAERSLLPGFDGPVVRSYGPMLTAPGGYCSRAEWAPEGTAWELSGLGQVDAAVARLAGLGVIGVKVALNAEAGPTLDDLMLGAVVDAAHRHGLPVAAHAQGRGQVRRALLAGVDEFAHTPWTERIPEAEVAALARRCRMHSTLNIHASDGNGEGLDNAVANLGAFWRAGGDVRYGTDLGNGPIPEGVHAGEVALLAGAGLGPEDVLASMAGYRLRLGGRDGVIALGADPRENLAAVTDVRAVAVQNRVIGPGVSPGA
jgi:hypothetical protein